MVLSEIYLQIGLSLSEDIRKLIVSGLVTIQITSLSNGSVIVNFSIIFLPNSNLDMLNVSTALMESLQNSTVYTVDKNSIHIEGTAYFVFNRLVKYWHIIWIGLSLCCMMELLLQLLLMWLVDLRCDWSPVIYRCKRVLVGYGGLLSVGKLY